MKVFTVLYTAPNGIEQELYFETITEAQAYYSKHNCKKMGVQEATEEQARDAFEATRLQLQYNDAGQYNVIVF